MTEKVRGEGGYSKDERKVKGDGNHGISTPSQKKKAATYLNLQGEAKDKSGDDVENIIVCTVIRRTLGGCSNLAPRPAMFRYAERPPEMDDRIVISRK